MGGALSAGARPRLYVCHGDDSGPRFHPCRKVQEALRDAGAILGWVEAQRGGAKGG